MRISRLTIFLILLSQSIHVAACSCARTLYERAFFNSKYVAYGKVYEVKKTTESSALVGKFKPIKVYKGQHSSEFRVLGSDISDVSCNEELKEGEYLIFSEDGVRSHVSACSSSHELRESRDLILKYIQSIYLNPPTVEPPKKRGEYLDQRCKIYGSMDNKWCKGNAAASH